MPNHWLRAAAILAAVMLGTPARAISGQQLLRQCEALDRGVVQKGGAVAIPGSRDAVECWAYMAAVQDFAGTVEQEGGPSILGSCPSSDTTRLDFVRAFLRYGRGHPADLDLKASVAVILALQSVYPCAPRP